MQFTSLDAVIFTGVFLVPGFIWSAVLSMLVPRKSRESPVRMLEFLTLSCINHALWIWLLVPVFKTGLLQDHAVWAGLALFVPTFASPIGLGLLTGHLYQTDWPRRVLQRWGFRSLHQAPTAWDYQFSRGQRYLVLVTFRDRFQVWIGYRINSRFAG